MKFKKSERKVLTEIYRRLNALNNGDLDTKLLLLALPSEVKVIKHLGFLKPASSIIPRVLNWYNLTEEGKKFFSNHLHKVSNEENLKMFEGEIILDFQ